MKIAHLTLTPLLRLQTCWSHHRRIAKAPADGAYLRDRVSERERYRISAFYLDKVTGEIEKATEA